MQITRYESQVFSISQEQLNRFAKSSSGNGRIHIDPDYAKHTPFQKPLVHGLFLQGFIERELNKQFVNWNETGCLDITFVRPVKVDERFIICFDSGNISNENEIHIEVIKDTEQVIVGKAILSQV